MDLVTKVSENANVDAAELKKFDAMAASWWDPEGDFKPLHDLNPVRMQFIADHAAVAGARVVDVGCGAGLLLRDIGLALGPHGLVAGAPAYYLERLASPVIDFP